MQDLSRSCQDLTSSGKIFEEMQDEILRFCQDIQDELQDLTTKESKIDSKNIFVVHVVLVQATLPETEHCPYSEVEALC